MHDENEARRMLRTDERFHAQMAWPSRIAMALAYVATELQMHVGKVAYAYLMASESFGKRETIKRHFAPIVDLNSVPDWEHVYYPKNFGGVLGPYWLDVVNQISRAVHNASAIGVTKFGRDLTAALAKAGSDSMRQRLIADAVEGVIGTLTRQALADLNNADRPADAAGFAAN